MLSSQWVDGELIDCFDREKQTTNPLQLSQLLPSATVTRSAYGGNCSIALGNMSVLLELRILGANPQKVFVGAAIPMIQYEDLGHVMMLDCKHKLIQEGGLPRLLMYDS
ncbi:MAG TPA: hypothetical protein VGO56_22510 [Pyrinomonadaceae bacterium]|nr:hypothetical protein [Pyrinomonadaceae bacterium]